MAKRKPFRVTKMTAADLSRFKRSPNTYILGRGSWGGGDGYAPVSEPAIVSRMVATRGDVPISRFQATLESRKCIEGRTKHFITDAVSSVRFIFGGYWTGNAEYSLGNNQTIQVAMEIPAGQSGGPTGPTYVVQGTFDASPTGVIVDGVAEYISDPISASSFGISEFPAGLYFWLRQRRTVSLSEYWPAHPTNVVGVGGEGSFFSDGLQTSQLVATGNMSTPSGGASAGYSILPLAIIGDVAGGNKSVLGIGDSIMYYSNDVFSDGSAGGGWFARGLYSVSGNKIAWGRVARGTSKVTDYVGEGGSEKRAAMYKYFSNVVIHYGTNDGAAGRTAAQTQADMQTLIESLKSAGVKSVVVSIMFPRCATTDSGATVANQTPISNFATGGAFRDPMNAWAVANVGTYHHKNLDLAVVVADATALDKWKAGYSTDTIHPSSGTTSATLGSSFSTWAETNLVSG